MFSKNEKNNRINVISFPESEIISSPLQINPSNANTDKFLNSLKIPEPTRSLLWITDEDVSKIQSPMSFVIEFRTTSKEPEKENYRFYAEPSLIWTRLPIKPNSQHFRETFYYPSYPRLTPDLRWEYLTWLKDVTQETNISFVFLYYYGLERHLLFGDYDKATKEIVGLLKFHKNRSFSQYVIGALIAASAYKKRFDIIDKYPSLLKELTNEAFYLRMLAGVDISSEDIWNLFCQKMIGRNHFVIQFADKHQVLFKKELVDVYKEYYER